MAAVMGISPSSVGRIWAEAGSKPHLVRRFRWAGPNPTSVASAVLATKGKKPQGASFSAWLCLMISNHCSLGWACRKWMKLRSICSSSHIMPTIKPAGTMAPRLSFESAMFDLVDLLLLRRGIPADDRTLAFRRVDGDQSSNVIYFLPWHTPFAFARHAGFAPLNFLACYEMPNAIVSSEPELCAQAMIELVEDAEHLLAARGIADPLIIGLSAGSYPATYLANRIGARLCSVASADRGDLAIWESPATRIIKRRAMHKGYDLSHYSDALSGTHPAENFSGIAPDSIFVMGERDPYVPARCKTGLVHAIATHAPGAQIIKLDAGHFKTLMVSSGYQRRMLGIEESRGWQLRMPSLSLAQLSLPWSATQRQ
jgi:hypothetical protein